MPDLRTKALGYLRDGKVAILTAATDKPNRSAGAVGAIVKGFHGEHWVRLVDGVWFCSCNNDAPRPDCAHVAAVQLVTGHESAAAREAKAAAS